ncbi:MAG: hypothetical protein H0U76_20385 [Ktedonobacteraceae bacterium]|nr:hypothetical protein [Ktedonobacteraceae bacterium]
MSILRDPQSTAQALAARLTVYQRMLLGKAGMPRWFDLAYPWEPALGRQTQEAGILASAPFGLLMPAPTYLGGYELTPLGERVAAIFLLHLGETEQRAATLAYTLTPMQRSVLCLVATLGVLFAAELDSLREVAVARGLANPEYGVLAALGPVESGSFTLTALGEAVTEELLLGVRHD